MRRILALLLVFVVSCGGSRQETADGFDKALNTTTDVVDPLYGSLVIACDLAEGVIIQRESNAAEAATKLTRLRGTCDGIYESIEGLRDLQRLARQAVDAYREGELDLSDVISAIAPVTQSVKHIKAAVQEFRDTYGSDVDEPTEPPPTSDLGAWDRYLDSELRS